MMDRAESILTWLISIPDWTVYLILGLAAALENIVPPIPADVTILAGGVVAGTGTVSPLLLFLIVWFCNVGSALLVYVLGLKHGSRFFSGRIGTFLLAPAQVAALGAAYRRHGFPIIFFSRFLPVFRPIVPAFAGVANLGFWGTAIPIALASGIWYGLLVFLGTWAGANWRSVLSFLSTAGGSLWLLAAGLITLLGIWWWRTRRWQVRDGGNSI